MKREKKKTHCFIDYENVHESGFEGVETLVDGDAVTIFISSVSHKISLVVLETLLRKKCELNIIHTIGTGKNNLDFQLIAEVGYQIGRDSYNDLPTRFAIISKDRGYENVVTAFLNRGVDILQCETIKKIGQNVEVFSEKRVEESLDPGWAFAEPIRNCLIAQNLSVSELKKVDEIFMTSHSLHALHANLVKAFGKKGNHPVYSKLKALHKQYQKTLPPAEAPFVDAQPEPLAPFLSDPASHADIAEAEEGKSLEVFWDQLLEESGGYPHAADEQSNANLEVPAEARAETPLKAAVPRSEVKKRTRGQKKKHPAAKLLEQNGEDHVPERVLDSVTAPAAEPVPEPQAGFVPDYMAEPLPDQASAAVKTVREQDSAEAEPEQAQQSPEKKKRRPGRPRKKNGSTRRTESSEAEADQTASGLEAQKTAEAPEDMER